MDASLFAVVLRPSGLWFALVDDVLRVLVDRPKLDELGGAALGRPLNSALWLRSRLARRPASARRALPPARPQFFAIRNSDHLVRVIIHAEMSTHKRAQSGRLGTTGMLPAAVAVAWLLLSLSWLLSSLSSVSVSRTLLVRPDRME
jgi:hypothetical protein